jgi:hypothetical protein
MCAIEKLTIWQQMSGVAYGKQKLIESYLDIAARKLGSLAGIDDVMFDWKALVFLSEGHPVLVVGELE